MNAINDLLTRNNREQDTLRKLGTPLATHLGIDSFALAMQRRDGSAINMSNCPDITEAHFTSDMWRDFAFMCDPDHLVSTGLVFLEEDPGFSRVLSATADQVWLYHPAGLLRKDAEGNTLAFFFASRDKNFRASVYVNNLRLLHLFCDYFFEASASLRDKFDSVALDMVSLRGDAYLCPYAVQSEPQAEAGCRFLHELGIDPLVLSGATTLSRREKQVLKATISGKMAPQIAGELCLSRRTVEHYVEGAKNKLLCSSREEFCAIGRILDAANLL